MAEIKIVEKATKREFTMLIDVPCNQDDHEYVETFLGKVFSKDFRSNIDWEFDNLMEKKLMIIANLNFNEGYECGFDNGYDYGRTNGYDAGYANGFDDGIFAF